MIIEDLIEINRRLSYDLWNVSAFNGHPSGLSPRLIFPVNRINGEIRISEQEARILYCNILNSLNYFYSIETPTDNAYIQSGKTGVSALSDLSIYTYNNNSSSIFNKMVNVEFKAGTSTYEGIRKDIEKIITEGKDGNWFHILKNIDRRSLPVVYNRFIKSIQNHFNQSKKISILFCICILELESLKLEKKWGMIKHFEYDSSLGKNIPNYMEEFFCMDKNNDLNNIDGKNLETQKDTLKNNGWMIVEQ